MSKLTVCKTCKKEIAKSVRVCPHCGAKLKIRKLKFVFGTIIAFIVIIIAIASTGENSSPRVKQENSVKTNTKSESKPSTTATNSENSKSQNNNKETDLLSFIGKNETEIKKSFGNPTKVDGAESGQVYDYGSFYFAIGDNKAVGIGIKSSGMTVNGIAIGMTTKDVKGKLGNPTKESNSSGFIMEYKLNNNTISIQYCFDDFSSPVKSIIVTDLAAGKEKPMEVTKEQVNQLMNGTWVLEKNIHEKNLSLYKHVFFNGIIDTNLSEHLQKKYEVTSPNTITMRGETLNGFGSTEKLEAMFFIEFFDNGDRMVIYHLDQAGDRDSEDVYIRYN